MITFTQSLTDSFATIILSSRLTTDMNFITASHIICPYPQLLRRRVALAVGPSNHTTSNSIRKLKKMKFAYYLSTLDRRWKGDCGTCCPGLWRTLGDSYGLGATHWGGLGSETFPLDDGDYDLAMLDLHKHFKWTLGGVCRNSACLYYGLASVFDRYGCLLRWCYMLNISPGRMW